MVEIVPQDYGFENVIDALPIPVVVLTPDNIIQAASDAFFGRFRLEREFTIGKNIFDLCEKWSYSPAVVRWLGEVRLAANDAPPLRIKHPCSTDPNQLLELHVSPLPPKGPVTQGTVLLSINSVDVPAADARSSIEDRFSLLVKNISDHSIFTVDTQGYINTWNKEAERILGFSEQEAIGQHFSIIFSTEDRAAGIPASELAQSLAQGRAEDERWHRRKNGELFWALGIVSPTHDGEGKLTGYAKILRDMTERKLSEDALRDGDRRKDEFLATLAHELRNPMAPLRNGLQLLRLAKDETSRNESLDMMDRQLAQLVRLVDDLLDIGRIRGNKLELRKSRVTLSSVIECAIESARPQIDAGQHQLTVDLPREPIELEGDMTRLAQVFWNLLNNSAKFTPPGGTIRLAAIAKSSQVVVTVQDNGIGFADEQRPHLFEMFSQVKPTLERTHGGLGIGLSLVKKLVEAHGGRVDAQSDGLGRGATFSVFLPLAEAQPHAEPAPESAVTMPATRRRVLVVDDNRDSAISLARLLEVMGNETRVAHDGETGISVAEKFHPDLVVLDIGLPNLNGYDVCRHIRQQTWGESIVMVAATGWGQPEDRRRSLEAGFDHHLVKPIDAQAVNLLAKGC